jgi:hypothetical protein
MRASSIPSHLQNRPQYAPHHYISNCETSNPVEKYKKGTVPSLEIVSPYEISKTKELLFTTIEQTKEDYRFGVFSSFKEYSTSYGISLNSFEDAIQFNNIHESLHLGYMMAMVK